MTAIDHDLIIIGGGPAGLALSYHLGRCGMPHLILEQGGPGESWRSRRWDSLHLVAPNWHLRLPGHPYAGPDPDGFLHRDEVLDYITGYAAAIGAPLRAGVRVRAVKAGPGGAGFLLDTTDGAYAAAQLVVATGAFAAPRIPAWAAELPPGIAQLQAAAYRRPSDLPAGGVLVAGSGESGLQIAEELRRSGRAVWLAAGRGYWLPRRYRGRDSIWWLHELGALAQTRDSLPGGDVRNAPPGPQLTGAGGGRDLNLHTLARDGVALLGRLEGVDGVRLRFAGDLAERLAEADRAAANFCASVDAHIAAGGLAAPAEAAPSYRQAYAAADSAPRTLDLAASGVTAVVWATGYRPDYGWLGLPVCDAEGYPAHRRGVTGWPGLYFLGLEWLHTAASAIFLGIGDDAAYLAEVIREGRASRA
jgi:putative flavoprotein involved in K+ transport